MDRRLKPLIENRLGVTESGHDFAPLAPHSYLRSTVGGTGLEVPLALAYSGGYAR